MSKSVRRALRDFRRDAMTTWGYGGLPVIQEALLERTVRRLYRRQIALLFEEDLATVTETPPPAGMDIRVLADHDWDRLARGLTSRTLERFRRRAITGTTCLVAWEGELPVGYAWLSEEAPPGSLPGLPSDTIYAWGLWVDPRERGRGVGSALVSARLSRARKRGLRRAWRVVVEDNGPALRTVEKSSEGRARMIGKLTYVTLLGRMRVRFTANPKPD